MKEKGRVVEQRRLRKSASKETLASTGDRDRLLSTYIHTGKPLTPHLYGLGYTGQPFHRDNFTGRLNDK